MQTRALPSILLLAVLALSLTHSAPAGQKGTAHTVLIKGFQFVPDHLEAAVGDTVTWTNEDIVPHTATSKKAFDSKGIEKGKSWTYTVRKAGSYPYICTFHPTMKAELIVK